ncbi:MAG: C25 family cysteine peptidase, partial [bacterium]|nr:C25 family cysteine peptidase [bacterium]
EQTRSQTLSEEGKENWFWRQISAPGDHSFSFELPGQKMEVQTFCSVRIKFYGVSHLDINPDHYLVISINQNNIGEVRWDGETAYIFSNDSVPTYYFQEGSNTLDISMPGAKGDPRGIAPDLDVVYLSWFEVDYWSEYRAVNDYIAYYYGGDSTQFGNESTLTITNFSNKNISIYDITSNTKIIPFVTATENSTEDTVFAAYSMFFPQQKRHDYIALTDERMKTPVKIEKKQSSYWDNPALSADYIIITHRDFYSTLIPLVEWRKKQGLRVQIIAVDELFDIFNDGIFHPKAIRDFLRFAFQQWQAPPPKYVLLVGDASWDIKGSLNLADGRTFIPVYFYPSSSGYAACDNWYACVDGDDDIPKFAIGRIPAHSVDEASAVVNKILEYEQNPEYGSWRQSVLLLATPRDWTARVNDELMRNFLPKQLNPLPRYSTPTSYFNIRPENVIEWINQGQFLVHFAGHASVFNWDIGRPGEEGAPETVGYKERGFFGTRHVPRLNNEGKYPLVISMTCYANQFDSMWSDGIGEALLKADKAGAIACVGGTYRVSQSSFEMFDRSFLRFLFGVNQIRLGDAFLSAQQEVNNDEVNNLYTLLGDPGLLISIPEPLELRTERKQTTDLQSEFIMVTSSNQIRSEKLLQGIVQLRTLSGNFVSSEIIPSNQKEWETRFTISSTYRNDPLVITVNLWNQNSKRFAAGRDIVNPITAGEDKSKNSETIKK